MTHDTCALAAHPKIDAIDRALRGGRHPAVVAAQFRIAPALVAAHTEHLFAPLNPPRSGVIIDRRAMNAIPHAGSHDPDAVQPAWNEAMSDDSMGTAQRQDEAERAFRRGWAQMNRHRREQCLVWLQAEVEAMLRDEDRAWPTDV